ncbi:hypothetical protein N0V93_009735 [Gnomoniopsis smithogilvyi]|uniref:Uncharacterized protein n=1 Tax=Gnomoniopsis smithogilvyi TaxID=1191159 RepID=A0A9W8YKF6_9PEZI|nr:hypothetical protein N0V93_009735 [Gnomoniopsis smithogilvyi]
MLEELRSHFSALVTAHPWVTSLANILPLSALVDFLDVPRTLHIFQLSHSVPLWCWSVTPYGSRFLFSASAEAPMDQCCLDEFGRTPGLLCVDGRYGDCYPAMSPETLRMCIDTLTPVSIKNSHANMKRGDIRPHTLDVIHVQRERPPRDTQRRRPPSLLCASALGWLLLGGLLVACGITQCWWAFSFLTVIPFTGLLISHVQVSGPRRLALRRGEGGEYNRLVLAAKHMNETKWIIFYGESTAVNSLLNWPLRKTTSATRPRLRRGLQMVLRLLILSQWVLAVAAAALSGWDAYIISLWVLVCIFAHTTLFSASQTMPDWMRRFARISMTRYQTQLSSRRALLNTVLALNPDKLPQSLTFVDGQQLESSNEGLAWADHILKGGADRVRWVQCSQIAMEEWEQHRTLQAWKQQYKCDNSTKRYPHYWVPFVEEGVEIGAMIIDRAGLTGLITSKIV